MKWISAPNSDEHVLCDDAGRKSEYRVRRDPVTSVFSAYDGERRLHSSLAIYSCFAVCRKHYEAERALPKQAPKNRKGRYSKRESA